MSKHWYLVGQSAGARIFEQDGIKKELLLVRRFENPEGALKTSELVSDRQGRFDSGNMTGHNAVGNVDAPRKHVLNRFAKELGEFLEQNARQNAYESIVLIAESHVLGEIKKTIGKATTQRLLESISKNLGHIADQDMMLQLEGALCRCEDIRA